MSDRPAAGQSGDESASYLKTVNCVSNLVTQRYEVKCSTFRPSASRFKLYTKQGNRGSA